jgi:murein L,D-transpeptidase YcbB/YkuD
MRARRGGRGSTIRESSRRAASLPISFVRVAAAALLLCVALPAFAQDAADEDACAAEIASIVAAGRLDALRWPDLADVRRPLGALYAPRRYAPLFSSRGRPARAAREVATLVAGAASRGLDPADYDAARLRAWTSGEVKSSSARDAAEHEVSAAVAILRHLSDVHVGRVSPPRLGAAFDVEPKQLDLAARVAEAVRDDRLAELVAEAEPPLAQNAWLEGALAAYRRLAADPTLTPPLLTPPLKPGAPLPEAPALAAWLAAFDDLDRSYAAGTLYDDTLVAGVKHFQGRHGLTQDGVIGKATAAALAVPIAQRVRQLELALERLRWLPDLSATRFVIVNVPSFELFAFDAAGGEGRPALEMRVVVGKAARTQTPILTGRMRTLEFVPYWNVPRSIAMKEILPKLQADPGYLASEHMELVQGERDVSPVVGLSSASLAALAAGEVRIRQRPGPKNALGRVKFLFPNAANVYLHDTPSRSLFARERRDFSHGCVRVADPESLAVWALRDQPDTGEGAWTPERVREAMEGTHQRIAVASPILVVLFYTTAVAREAGHDGRVHFFPDLYGHDAALERALAHGYPYPR